MPVALPNGVADLQQAYHSDESMSMESGDVAEGKRLRMWVA